MTDLVFGFIATALVLAIGCWIVKASRSAH